jgi:hypothetical protein
VHAAGATLNGVTESQDAKSMFPKSVASVKNRPIQKAAQQAFAPDGPSKVFVEVDFATLNKS